MRRPTEDSECGTSTSRGCKTDLCGRSSLKASIVPSQEASSTPSVDRLHVLALAPEANDAPVAVTATQSLPPKERGFQKRTKAPRKQKRVDSECDDDYALDIDDFLQHVQLSTTSVKNKRPKVDQPRSQSPVTFSKEAKAFDKVRQDHINRQRSRTILAERSRPTTGSADTTQQWFRTNETPASKAASTQQGEVFLVFLSFSFFLSLSLCSSPPQVSRSARRSGKN
jgi:hypothetical protein